MATPLWASYQPISGSSVTIYAPNNNTTAIPVSGSGAFSVTGSTITVFPTNGANFPITGNLTGNQNVAVAAALPSGTNNIGTVTGSTVTVFPTNGATFPVSVATPYIVIQTTVGVNSSTIAVVNAVGTTLSVTGSTVTVFPTNGSTFPVSVATPYTVIETTVGVNSSTVAVVNAVGTTLSVTGSTVTVFPTNGTSFPISGNLTGNQAINLVQVGGNAVVTGGTNGSQGVGGLAASTATASGNPVLIGAVFNASQPTLTEGQIINSQVTKHGNFIVATGADNFSANLVSVGTASVVTGTGASGAGIPRVTISNDSSLAANQSVNVAQFGGTNVTNDGTSGVPAVGGHKADNGGAAGTDRLTTMPSIYQTDYLNGTAATQGRNGAVSQGTDGLLWVAPLPAMRPASYSASTNTITLAAAATDIAAVCGNATNTVLVYAVRASCTQTTAGIIPITILKRSTAYNGAWSTMTMVSQDSNYTTAISSAIWFTSNPTVGTIIGAVDNYKMGCLATGTASPNDIYISPSDWRMKPIVLRGAGQCLAINLESTTVTGGAFTATFEWIETKTITP